MHRSLQESQALRTGCLHSALLPTHRLSWVTRALAPGPSASHMPPPSVRWAKGQDGDRIQTVTGTCLCLWLQLHCTRHEGAGECRQLCSTDADNTTQYKLAKVLPTPNCTLCSHRGDLGTEHVRACLQQHFNVQQSLAESTADVSATAITSMWPRHRC